MTRLGKIPRKNMKVHHFCNMQVSQVSTLQHLSEKLWGLLSNCSDTDREESFRMLRPEMSLMTCGNEAFAWAHRIFFLAERLFPVSHPPPCPITPLTRSDNLRYIMGKYILRIWAGFILYSWSHQLCLLYNLLAATTALLRYLYPATSLQGFSSFRMGSLTMGFSYKLCNKREISFSFLKK